MAKEGCPCHKRHTVRAAKNDPTILLIFIFRAFLNNPLSFRSLSSFSPLSILVCAQSSPLTDEKTGKVLPFLTGEGLFIIYEALSVRSFKGKEGQKLCRLSLAAADRLLAVFARKASICIFRKALGMADERQLPDKQDPQRHHRKNS